MLRWLVSIEKTKFKLNKWSNRNWRKLSSRTREHNRWPQLKTEMKPGYTLAPQTSRHYNNSRKFNRHTLSGRTNLFGAARLRVERLKFCWPLESVLSVGLPTFEDAAALKSFSIWIAVSVENIQKKFFGFFNWIEMWEQKIHKPHNNSIRSVQ